MTITARLTTAEGSPASRTTPPTSGRPPSKIGGMLRATPWVAPSLLLILGVILVPVVTMVVASFQRIGNTGVTQGFAGFDNYRRLFAEPALPQVMLNTLIWVLVVAGGSIVISLGLAQFLNKNFFGRRFVRLALIVPWAAALVITATVWRFILQGNNGILNRLLMDLGILTTPIGWYQDPRFAFTSVLVVGIIVTVPFTTYVLLAGLQTIPADVYEAAKVDGAGSIRTYWVITLPLLKPALSIATILVTVAVFNSFPVLWVITGQNSGNGADTTITWAYKIAFRQQLNIGEASALSVLNVLFLSIVILIYLRMTFEPNGRRRNIRLIPTRASSAIAHSMSSAFSRAGGRVRTRRSYPRLSTFWRRARPAVLSVSGLLIAAFFLAPYVVMFLGSLKSSAELFRAPATYLPEEWVWSNWVDVWTRIPLASLLLNSLVIAVVATGLVFVVSVPAAYYTARRRFVGRSGFLKIVLMTQTIAPVAVLVGLFQLFVGVDGVNEYWSIILANAAFNLAFAIWVLHSQFVSVPLEIEEAAQIDGLSTFRTMVRISLPLVKPGLVTALIFSFIQVWNEFPIALTLFNDPISNKQTLPVGIQQLVGLNNTEYQYLMVASLIAIVPIVALFLWIEKHLVSGLTAGSVK